MRRPGRPPPAQALSPPIEIAIARIGSAGDGVGTRGGTALHVARTLPGEVVLAQKLASSNRADLLQVLQPSSDRVAPPCPHFLQGCGGCALQHWNADAYAAWKRGLVVAALVRAGYAEPAVGALSGTPPYSRRRMAFAVRRREGGVLFGLHRSHDTEIVDLAVCMVLHATLFALVGPLRQTLSGLAALRRAGSAEANLLSGGADLLIRTDGPLTQGDRVKLAAFAAAHGVSRISWALDGGVAETASLLAAPFVLFDGHRVEPPPGAFLQASEQGERAIVQAVLDGLPQHLTGRSRAIELFAGCGTISFPVARHLRVLAYEGDPAAAVAVRRAQSGSRVEMTQRDLARQPLSAKELSGAAVVILDPPYGGAAAQLPLIAASGVGRVIYVSCNPGALARDAAVLAQAGYRLLQATPIDQFLWSAQVECVAVFEKGKQSFFEKKDQKTLSI